MKFVILYGSESDLIKDLYRQSEEFTLIRIHGSKLPVDNEGSVNINGNSDEVVSKLLNIISAVKKGDQIIFIGAAFLSDNSLLVSLKDRDIDRLLNINIISYVKLVSSLLPIMVRIRSGHFVYLSSFRSINPTKGAVIYSASKAFGESFFVGIAREYGRYGVKCNSLRMGYFDGRILSSLGGAEAIHKVTNRSALKRLGSADDLRKAILFLIDAPYTTGGTLDINGAMDFE
jgi:NAD(P)-dependent dehydrogenase (short-subunit alcohol dehydrogenase family)